MRWRLRRELVWARVRWLMARGRVRLVYVNTVAALDLVPRLRTMYGGPILCHLRELEMSIRYHCGSDRFRDLREQVDAYIVGSAGAETLLVHDYGIPRERIRFVPFGIEAQRESVDQEDIDAIRKELGIPADAFVVGGCGSINWWKAPDVFVRVARRVVERQLAPPVHFIWVGGGDRHAVDCVMYDVAKQGVGDHVHFVGPKVNPRLYFALFDAFFLSSREDMLPAVCLEAAAFEIPMVCFEGSGGAPEFVGNDAGFVVPYLDVESAAKQLILLRESPELREALGRRAADKVRRSHEFDQALKHLSAVLAPFLYPETT